MHINHLLDFGPFSNLVWTRIYFDGKKDVFCIPLTGRLDLIRTEVIG